MGPGGSYLIFTFASPAISWRVVNRLHPPAVESYNRLEFSVVRKIIRGMGVLDNVTRILAATELTFDRGVGMTTAALEFG